MYLIDTALYIIVSIGTSLTVTIIFWRYIIYKLKLKPLLVMGRRFASSMGQESQAVQHTAKLKQTQKIAKEKAMKGAVDSLPGGGILRAILEKSGLTGEEMFALMQDQDFLKGIKVIIDTFSGVGAFVKEKVTGQKSEQSGENQFGVM